MKPNPAQDDESRDPSAASVSLADLARQQGVLPLKSVNELRADIWESDEELDAFLADLRQSRDSDLA